jgi:hypothetical protein
MAKGRRYQGFEKIQRDAQCRTPMYPWNTSRSAAEQDGQKYEAAHRHQRIVHGVGPAIGNPLRATNEASQRSRRSTMTLIPESRMPGNWHVRFGGGESEKDPC